MIYYLINISNLYNVLKINISVDNNQWNNQNIIGLIVKKSNDNWLCGNIRLMYQTNTIWSGINANKSLMDILSEEGHGCKIYDSNNQNVHILVDRPKFPNGSDFYILLGIKSTYTF